MADQGDKKSFMADLAAKMAAGPPKKPVGLLKKPTISGDAQNKVEKEVSEQGAEAQKKLGDIMKKNPVENAAQDENKDKVDE